MSKKMPPKPKIKTKLKIKPKRASHYKKTIPKTKHYVPKEPFVVREETKETSVRRDECERSVNGYNKKDLLGQGASGSVYKLCDIENKCPYVLKVVNLQKAADIKQFELEVSNQRLASQIGLAPHILDAWICHPSDVLARGFIAMDYLGSSLKKYLSAHKHELSKEFLDYTVGQIRIAVDRLHSIDIEHGDLNENNIYYETINNQPRVMFIDFGLSGPRNHPKRPGRKDDKELEYLRREILPLIVRIIKLNK